MNNKRGRPCIYNTYEERYLASRENIKRYLEKNPKKRLLGVTKQNARKKGIEFNISENDIAIPEYCPILGIKLTNELGKGRLQSNISLDRLDSSKGYTEDNIWIISDLANRMKQEATPEQLVAFAEGILRLHSKNLLGRSL